ncbi:nose resistant to fluoxetine protein 6 isoform X2 [Cephus cinctus]|uniref:Nose resistant to fluoxetine protein 6 isoform X2 n=1 Tax=Cephus cinctus TaxID=211228 RepID=A0AAJ7RPF6_CEPCN|nr:nose resistant to fluoxetine protein 6 isoform X2 [Cephus cinctus]
MFLSLYDSSSKRFEGIISGNTRHYGNFDQCFNLEAILPVNENHPDSDRIAGRYCLIDFKFQKTHVMPHVSKPYVMEFDPNGPAWDAIQERGDFRRVKRYLMQLALCVPASCTAKDVEVALTETFKKFGIARNMRIETTVKQEHCQTKDELLEFSTASWIYCYVLLTLLALVVVGNWYDSSMENNELTDKSAIKDLILCFSPRRNLKTIFTATYNHPGLDCIHMIRIFFMSLVIFGHRTMQYYTNPVINANYLEWTYTFPSAMMVHNGTVIVDAYFGIGGLLVAYGILQELDKKKKISVIGLILVRFLRLTPSYMLVVFFNALILPHLGTGPYWEVKIGKESQSCRSNWWTNLLYVNNYVNPQNFCMFQAWYLAVDFHMYILGIFVVYVFWKWPRKLGYTLLVVLTIVSCVIPFVHTYFYNMQPIFMGLPYMREVRDDFYFINYYIKSHMRASSYLIGIIAGAIIHDHKKSTWKLTKAWSRIFFALFAVVLSINIQAFSFKFIDINAEKGPLITALFASLHRAAFSMSMCSVVVLITVGQGLDFHYNFLTPAWAQPLSRLTYGAFLVHNVNQIYEISVARVGRVFTFHNLIWDFVPDILFTMIISLILSITVEGPFKNIEKRFIIHKANQRDRETSNVAQKPKKID